MDQERELQIFIVKLHDICQCHNPNCCGICQSREFEDLGACEKKCGVEEQTMDYVNITTTENYILAFSVVIPRSSPLLPTAGRHTLIDQRGVECKGIPMSYRNKKCLALTWYASEEYFNVAFYSRGLLYEVRSSYAELYL